MPRVRRPAKLRHCRAVPRLRRTKGRGGNWFFHVLVYRTIGMSLSFPNAGVCRRAHRFRTGFTLVELLPSRKRRKRSRRSTPKRKCFMPSPPHSWDLSGRMRRPVPKRWKRRVATGLSSCRFSCVRLAHAFRRPRRIGIIQFAEHPQSVAGRKRPDRKTLRSCYNNANDE